MSTTLNPYLNFRDNARDVMDFYTSVFGGTLTRSTFAEFQVSDDPAENDKIMHSMLVTDTGLTLMAADVPNAMPHSVGDNISVSLSGDDEAELRGYWDGLTAGGNVVIPLSPSPWNDQFGMLRDRFGVNWLVNIAAPTTAETISDEAVPRSTADDS